MQKYKIEIREIYKYDLVIEANSKTDAIQKAKEYYKNVDDGVTGVGDANSLEETKFKLIK